MPLSFEEELVCLLEQARADGTPFEELEKHVHDLHRRHGRKILPPIVGTLEATDPEDKFGV
jgi:hypothetical protein